MEAELADRLHDFVGPLGIWVVAGTLDDPEPRVRDAGRELGLAMERYAHITAGQQREAADLLERALTVTLTVTESLDGVARSRPESPGEGDPRGNDGSGGREPVVY